MNISRHIPPELKSFWNVFDKLSYARDYTTIFDDFLTMCIFNFSKDNQNFKMDRDQALKKYEKKELNLFNECFREMILTFNNIFSVKEFQWYDFFGTLYETITSSYKSQAMGQFFTPPPVVDAMVKIINPGKNETVNDPACGSGRQLIAAHIHSGGCYVYGQDLDFICVKMTALNMFFHGCNGEVVWGNSLDLMSYKKGFRISPHEFLPMPFINEMQKEESLIWRINQNFYNEYIATKEPSIKEKFTDTLFPDENSTSVKKQKVQPSNKINKQPKAEYIQESLF